MPLKAATNVCAAAEMSTTELMENIIHKAIKCEYENS